jgi:uncharacterized membrane protein YbhN (UPF0104 family)
MSGSLPPVFRLAWRVIGYAVALAVVVYIVWLIGERGEELARVLREARRLPLVLHVLLILAYFAAVPLCLGMIVRASGMPSRARAILAAAYLPNLGKYIPGKIWSVAGRALLLSRLTGSGTPRAVGAAILQYGYEIAGSCGFVCLYVAFSPVRLAGLEVLALATALVPIAALFAGPLTCIGWKPLSKVAKKWTELGEPPKLGPGIIVAFFLQWAIYAASGAALVSALVDVDGPMLVAAGAAFVVAWLIGFVSLLTPGGIGVREAVAVALLAPIIGESAAVLATIAARVSWTIGDGVSVMVGLAAAGRIGRNALPAHERK